MGEQRRLDVQGLRGVAVAAVVVFHAWPDVLPGGFVGVDVFFVISGFVIASMLIRQLDAGTFRFRDFYVRRARRLLPALGVLLVFVALAGTLLLSPFGPQQATGRTGVAAALFHANFQLNRVPGGYFDLAAETNALLHTWSLSLEEQFYVLLPAVFVGVWRLSTRFDRAGTQRRTVGAVVAMLTLASFAHSVDVTLHPSIARGWDYGFYSPFSRAWEFGVGILAALWAPRLPRVFGWVGGAGIVAAAVLFDGGTVFPGPWALLPVLSTAAVIGAVGGLSQMLSARPLVWLGDLSYSLYLWHWPLIVFATAMWPRSTVAPIVGAVVSLGPAVLSYRLVEQPIRHQPRVVGWRALALVVTCSLVPVAGFAGLRAVTDVERAAAEDLMAGLGEYRIDHSGRLDDAGGTVVLVGDSNAAHLIAPAEAAAERLGLPFTPLSQPGCPFVDLVRESGPHFDGDACHASVLAALDRFAQDPPLAVVVAMAGPQYLTADALALTDPETGQTARSSAEKAVVWERGLTRTLDRLDELGVPVVVVHSVPHLGQLDEDWSVRSCPAVRTLTGRCGITVPRGEAEARRAAAVSIEDRVTGGAAIDLADDICTPAVCSARRNGRWVYRDATHLAISGALTLTDRIEQAVGHASTSP